MLSGRAASPQPWSAREGRERAQWDWLEGAGVGAAGTWGQRGEGLREGETQQGLHRALELAAPCSAHSTCPEHQALATGSDTPPQASEFLPRPFSTPASTHICTHCWPRPYWGSTACWRLYMPPHWDAFSPNELSPCSGKEHSCHPPVLPVLASDVPLPLNF